MSLSGVKPSQDSLGWLDVDGAALGPLPARSQGSANPAKVFAGPPKCSQVHGFFLECFPMLASQLGHGSLRMFH